MRSTQETFFPSICIFPFFLAMVKSVSVWFTSQFMVLEEHVRESYDMVRQIGKGFSINMITWRSEGWDDATMYMRKEKDLQNNLVVGEYMTNVGYWKEASAALLWWQKCSKR